jgi:hypothetical protein
MAMARMAGSLMAAPVQGNGLLGLYMSGNRNCHRKGPLRVFTGDLAVWPGGPMHIDVVTLQPLFALIFGILILILPRLLNYLIAIYLIVIGLAGLFPHLFATPITQ